MSNPLKKLASQTAVYGLGSVLPRVITFFYSFVLSKLRTENDNLNKMDSVTRFSNYSFLLKKYQSRPGLNRLKQFRFREVIRL